MGAVAFSFLLLAWIGISLVVLKRGGDEDLLLIVSLCGIVGILIGKEFSVFSDKHRHYKDKILSLLSSLIVAAVFVVAVSILFPLYRADYGAASNVGKLLQSFYEKRPTLEAEYLSGSISDSPYEELPGDEGGDSIRWFQNGVAVLYGAEDDVIIIVAPFREGVSIAWRCFGVSDRLLPSACKSFIDGMD